MKRRFNRQPWHRETDVPGSVRYVLLLTLLVICAMAGGGSRTDILGMILVKPIAVVIGTVGLLLPGPIRWHEYRHLFILLGLFALLMVVQLIPLPPGLWFGLPGHGQFRRMLETAGAADAWRPLSLSPALTVASLTALSVPAAALVLLAGIPRERAQGLISWLVALVAISAFFGAAQIAGGPDSPFYLYRVTNPVNAVGLFSNRNHQALLLVLGIPILTAWVVARQGRDISDRVRWPIVGLLVLFLLPILAVTGSRAGILFVPFAFGAALLMLRYNMGALSPRHRALLWRVGPVVLLVVLIGGAILLARTEGLARLMQGGLEDEPRIRNFPTMWRILWDFFPTGIGFGAFDPAFRLYEPFELLKHEYFNHAHNDVLELVMTGGLAALLLGIGLLFWLVPRCIQILTRKPSDPAGVIEVMGVTIIVFSLIFSITDYPLRTPLFSLIFAIACAWINEPLRHRSGRAVQESA